MLLVSRYHGYPTPTPTLNITSIALHSLCLHIFEFRNSRYQTLSTKRCQSKLPLPNHPNRIWTTSGLNGLSPLNLMGRFYLSTNYPSIRRSSPLWPAKGRSWRRSTTLNQRQIKLQIYKDIISFYHQETNDKMFKKRWEELHDPKVVGMSLKARLESGQKGKESANAYVPHSLPLPSPELLPSSSSLHYYWWEWIGWRDRKYKDHNWFGAMYTYALAWGCLIPYHPDSMSASDPKKGEIASL